MSDEEEALAELKQMSHDQLMKVDHTEKYWICCVRMCKGYTKILDFGISPFFYWRKTGFLNMRWEKLLCGKHNIAYKAGRVTEYHFKPIVSGLRMIVDEKPVKKKLPKR